MKTEFQIIMIMILLVSASLFLISQNPDDTPKSSSFDKYSDEIVQINEKSKKYQSINDVRKFDESKKLMQEKLGNIASDLLGINASVSGIDYNFPLTDGHQVEIMGDESFPVCNVTENIPVHLQEIQNTKKFQMFVEKYFKYPIELNLQDERRHDSSFHYGLIAKSDDGQTALTMFHVNSCTNQITDSEKYLLSCRNGENEHISSINKKDVIASLNLDDFCTIPLDKWRQSVYDYGKTLYEDKENCRANSEIPEIDHETIPGCQSEMYRLGLLGNIVGMLVSDTDEDVVIEEKIREYNKTYHGLPDELLQLLEEKNED